MRELLSKLGLSLTFTLAATSCGGTASTVCDLVCECEHCNDIKEDFVCAEAQAQADVADAYGCAQEWEDWAACFEEKGTCDAEDVRYTTRVPGSCSGEMDTGFPCATSNDCNTFGADTCTNGTCKTRVCSGSNQPCQSSSDCSSGEDRCEVESERLFECQRAASDDPRFFSGGQAQPAPGGN